MTNWRLKWVLIAVCFALTANGATYYVAKTGNDLYAGTVAQPFQTIKKGLGAIKAGDSLFIRGGTYSEAISSNNQTIPTGTSWMDAPIISGFPNEVAILQGQAINLPHGYIQYLSIENLVLDGQNTADNVISIGSSGAHHVRFKNCEVKNAGHILVFFHGHNNIFTGGHVHHVGNTSLYPRPTNRHYGFYSEGSDNLIENTEIDHTNDYAIHGYSGYPEGSNRNVYRNLKLHETSLLYASGAAIVIGRGDGSVAYNNIIYNSTGHGIAVGAGPTNARVFNNSIYGGAQTGIYVCPDAVNTTVRNNIAYGNATVQILDQGSGTTLSNNFTANPSFVNASGFDFHLLSGSAAINAGVTISEVSRDFDGVARPQGPAYDIGAYEYVAAPVIHSRQAGIQHELNAITIGPAGSGVFIRWNGQSGANVSVYSPVGKQVFSLKNIGLNGTVWNTRESPAAIYLVRVQSEKSMCTAKVYCAK